MSYKHPLGEQDPLNEARNRVRQPDQIEKYRGHYVAYSLNGEILSSTKDPVEFWNGVRSFQKRGVSVSTDYIEPDESMTLH